MYLEGKRLCSRTAVSFISEGEMKDYIVVLANSRQELVDQVNARMKEGYTLVGGVSMVLDGLSIRLAQAMAK